jgi:hypothetical protein
MNRNKKIYTKNYETYTDKITKEQISDMLKYYKKIDTEEISEFTYWNTFTLLFCSRWRKKISSWWHVIK